MSSEAAAAPEPAPTAQSQQTVHPAVAYREIMSECSRYMQKIAELEVDRNEHVLVEDTLQGIQDKDGTHEVGSKRHRRAYRLVGDVLVERTVEEVLPSVTQHKDKVRCQTKQWTTPNEQ